MTRLMATFTRLVMYWARPVLILICGMLLFNLPTLLYKLRLFLRGIMYLLFCNDKKWEKPSDPGVMFAQLKKEEAAPNSTVTIERKTIYLVRHGESTWNDTFNKGKHRSAIAFAVGFIPGIFKALMNEMYLILSGKMDSWFYDAPLSHLGLSQVNDLGMFLKKPPKSKDPEYQVLSVLRGDPSAPPSTLISSSLRRSISTIAGGFRDRLSRHPDEKILIVPSLQEISRNPDTLSITPPHTMVTPSWMEKSSKICDFSFVLTHQVDVSLHNGNKPISTNGLIRMTDFCDYVFTLKEDHIICGGHSIWFRSFFRTFLPYTIDHVSKTRKVVNCGIVSVVLMKASKGSGATAQCCYMIDPQSIKVVHGGFD